MADTRWNIRKIAGHCRPGLIVAKMDWITKLVSADGGDPSVAIVDTRPLKRIVQEISPAPMFCETRWAARKNPRCARLLVSGR